MWHMWCGCGCGCAQEEDRGVIFRAVKLLFDKIARREAEGCSCDVSTSLVEVYNDSIHDLMAAPVKGKVGMVEHREKLELRSSKSGETDTHTHTHIMRRRVHRRQEHSLVYVLMCVRTCAGLALMGWAVLCSALLYSFRAQVHG
jgi:hypothetical protein